MEPPDGTGPDRHDADRAPYGVPRIPASAGALIFDGAGRLLVLKPTYKSGWTVPGGQMEDDGETPWEACRREVREECGLVVGRGRLACVDFLRPRPDRPGGMRFLFDCGPLADDILAGIALQEDEISEHRLVAPDEAFGLLSGPVRRRVRAALGSARHRVPRGRAAPRRRRRRCRAVSRPGVGAGRVVAASRAPQLRSRVPGRESRPSGTGSPSARIGTPFTRTWVMPTGWSAVRRSPSAGKS